MIDYFRTEVEKLNDEERGCIRPISSLAKPCQLNIISSFNHGHHLVIKTHFSELEDRLIRITQLGQHSFAAQLRDMIVDPKFLPQIKKAESHHGSYPCPDGLAYRIILFGRVVRSELNQASVGYHGLSLRVAINPVAVWQLGSMDGWDYKKVVNESINDFKADAVRRKETTMRSGASYKQPQTSTTEQAKINTTQESRQPSGFGTCFYPPILIGELSSTIEAQIHQKTEPLAKNILVAKIGGMKIAVSKGGLLGVQTDDPETAEKILNVIMAVSLICGLPTSFVQKPEVAHIYFESEFKMRASEWMMSSLRMQAFDSLVSPWMNHRGVDKEQISLDDLERIVGHCERVWSMPKNHRFLELVLSAHTFLSDDIYWQSFLSSWTVIELHIHGLWKNKLKKSDATERIICNLNRLNTNNILEVLYVDELVTKSDYQNWNKMRMLRNNVIHRGRTITKEQANECYKIARAIVKRKMKITDTVSRKTVYYL